MKTHFSDKKMAYDGTQLRSLFAYLQFSVLGDSVVSWVGPCDVSFEHMVDGEDLLAKSEIRGSEMVHFIVEKFDIDLFAAVALQRLMTSLALDVIRQASPNKEMTNLMHRDGDDIFYKGQKLSISIATKSATSTLIHFAVNVVNDGTPVPTLCLGDLQITPQTFSHNLMERFSCEADSILNATRKVKYV
jgi:hypothetical protein